MTDHASTRVNSGPFTLSYGGCIIFNAADVFLSSVYRVSGMQSDREKFLEETSSGLERMQREARILGLLPIAYLIELTREEVFDELRRTMTQPAPGEDVPSPTGPNILTIRRSAAS